MDLFGGSGLLSHTVKSVYPNAKVVYNDFDDFQKWLREIPQTNAILEELRALNIKTPRCSKIAGKERDQVLEVLKRANERGYVDWVSLSASLKFSMSYGVKYEDFAMDTLYNGIRKTNYDLAENYLNGIEVVQDDYRTVFERFKDLPNVVFIIDPPYLSTDISTYKNESYWKLTDYLEILDVIQENSYFYFTSNKSQIVELCQWLETLSGDVNPFKNAKCVTTGNSTGHGHK